MLTILVSVISVERRFSKLILIKIYLRSIMFQERLNELTLILIKNKYKENQL